MKLRFRRQKFQSDAANAVSDVFLGQPYRRNSFLIDMGIEKNEINSGIQEEFAGMKSTLGVGNYPIVLEENTILNQLRKVQNRNSIKKDIDIDGKYNLTIEMETGVGKTYTYIKTIFELNRKYGWSNFIVVVPSVAIREGVLKSFKITQEHFSEDYKKTIKYFVYNSKTLNDIDKFAMGLSINVMIINSQAFNARGKDARRIYMRLDEFRSRRPIDVIARTHPILIIDEPQSVEGKVTKEKLKEFSPLFTLRYSATHKSDSKYNMVYSLDAIEAYNKKLVKRIAVKGISISGSTAGEGYLYLQSVNISNKNPTATIEFDIKRSKGVKKVSKIMSEGDNIFPYSGELGEYKDGYTITRIDGRDSTVEFMNGKKLFAGDVIGEINEEHVHRLQIRETIISHLERESLLFSRGIKVLSLFFIDEVAKYKSYDDTGKISPGEYAKIFEEEYTNLINEKRNELIKDDYNEYLLSISAHDTHAGYFSIDRKGKVINSKLNDKKERTSDDTDAYDLIMKDKERLLDFNEPVRFIFSHSALREGWDNPNVFQICTLKQSGSEIRKRQEVGRGLRLCVNQDGERMDSTILPESEVQDINVLTVIANESYGSFAKGLQSEIADAVSSRPKKVEQSLFEGKFDKDSAISIYESLIENGYVKHGELTDKYFEDKNNGELIMPEEVQDREDDVIKILDYVYNDKLGLPEDARRNTVDLTLDRGKLNSTAFQKLWSRINQKSYYLVEFDEEELIKKSINALDSKLQVSKIYFKVETGTQKKILESKEQLQSGQAFVKDHIVREDVTTHTTMRPNSSIKYDLIGKMVAETGLTRKATVNILTGIQKYTFNMFKDNPEEFVIRASNIINEQKATTVIEHITYDKLSERYSTDIFTEPEMKKGRLDTNTMPAKHHLYDYVIYDSTNERDFAMSLEQHNKEVELYVKLPRGFYINTPVGKYNPDWAIAFYEDKVKHVYFIAETKGNMSSLELREIEQAKINCAKKHFKAISGDNVQYDVIDNYDSLWDLVSK